MKKLLISKTFAIIGLILFLLNILFINIPFYIPTEVYPYIFYGLCLIDTYYFYYWIFTLVTNNK
jgi:hypothetical protein